MKKKSYEEAEEVADIVGSEAVVDVFAAAHRFVANDNLLEIWNEIMLRFG